MSKPLFNKGFSGLGQLGILLGMVGAGLVVGGLISVGVWMGMTGQGPLTMQQDMLNPKFVGAIKVMQAVSTLFGFFLPAVGYAFVCYRNGWHALGFGHNKIVLSLLGISLLLIMCSGALIDGLSTLNKAIPVSPGAKAFFDKMERTYEEQVTVIAEAKTFSQYLLSLVMVALLPAVFEEVLFRGGLQNLLLRWWKKPWVAIVATSIVFSAIHGSWYGFLPRIALGLLLGGIFYTTQNIWYSIIVHFVNNAVVVTYMYWLTMNKKPVSLATESSFPWWAGIISLVVVVVLFRWLKKNSEQIVPQEMYEEHVDPFGTRNHTA
ncbi:MAG TPA: CPBP family intramembrane glutamic endopeptidase [Phnomibacter sp.]|nr:CPBP family intramembrane glutamic endopeptidase [Phnomibacter sp.]